MNSKNKITFSMLSKNYDLILISKKEELMKAFKQNKKIIVLGQKHKTVSPSTDNSDAPKWFKDFENRNNARLDKIENRLGNIENRLDNIVIKNKLIE